MHLFVENGSAARLIFAVPTSGGASQKWEHLTGSFD